jgi:hypothetical protein
MTFQLILKKGLPYKGSKEIQNYLKTLDGEYVVSILSQNNLTTIKNCRDAYFFKVDLVVQATGDERYDIHERFKTALNIDSTKNFTIVDWKNFIKQFQNYIFEQLDILI